VPWLVGVPVGAVLALSALRFKDRLVGGSGWRGRIAQSLRALELVLRVARSQQRYALAGIFLYWLGDVACLWSTLRAFGGHSPPATALIVGYATGYALTRRALPLGGAGVVEALLPFSLSWVGIPLASAVLAVVAYRLINLWLPMVPALAGLPTLRRLERGRRAHGRRSPGPRARAAGRHHSATSSGRASS
jgi:uncharacterized membrane protein YbhN (UPF0104 family)